MQTITLRHGFCADQRARAAALYWGAFGAKLNTPLGPETRALRFLARILDADHAITASDSDGRLVGLAGFKSEHGALTGGGLRDLAEFYGLAGTLWRAPLLSLLERKADPGTLLMDGICVAAEARGQGVGTRLLTGVADHARDIGAARVRLDVIDTNPRAQALYSRFGFVAGARMTLGPLRHIFGFNGVTTMTLPIAARS